MEFLETRSVYYLPRDGGHKVVVIDCVIYFLHFNRFKCNGQYIFCILLGRTLNDV